MDANDRPRDVRAPALSRRSALKGIGWAGIAGALGLATRDHGHAAAATSPERFAPGLAQEGAAPVGYSVGVVDERLGSGALAAPPGHELVLQRVTIQPGGRLSTPTHSGNLVIYTDSGSWAYTPRAGTTWLTRSNGPDGATTIPAPLIANSALNYDPVHAEPGITRELHLGTEVVLSAGAVLILHDPAATFVNRGDQPVVLLIAGLTRVGEPVATVMTEMDDEVRSSG